MSITTALKARREQLRDREAGFTLIELLVVVIIIGILAAIAIPVYIGVQNSAKDSSTKSDLANAKIAALAAYNASSPLAWPAVSATDGAANLTNLKNYGWTGTVLNATKAATADSTNFCFKATSGASNTFYVTANQAPGPIDTALCNV